MGFAAVDTTRMRPVFGTSFICALVFVDSGVAGGVAGAIDGIPSKVL